LAVVKYSSTQSLSSTITKYITGISAPYEEPLKPELVIDTDKDSVEESTDKVIDMIDKLGLLRL